MSNTASGLFSIVRLDMTRSIHYAPNLINVIARWIAWSVSKTLWFIRYEGVENIPKDDVAGFLVAANHQTYLDPLWIAPPIAGRKFRFMAIRAAFGWPIIGPLIRYLGSFPVSNDRRGATRAFRESINTLKDGGVLFIFPEGERRFSNDRSFEFKTGAAKIAIAANVPILPVTIRGGESIWPQGKRLPRLFRRVTVNFHPISTPPPQITTADTDKTAIEWTSSLARTINGYQLTD